MADVRMDYDEMEDLIRQAGMMEQALEELFKACMEAAAKIEGGGLVNRQGHRMVDQLRDTIAPYIRKQQEKFEEVRLDLMAALTALRDGDSEAASRFS